ncbi:universal stress protein [Gottfriedia luciferensis]|uniref:universal stress protein n=1 Tax=Gottfriedia luciferensis TaxID=178774 RepID=UPI000B44C0AE|nr:universal stress protein [Gottfriedia luciferensis]
MLSVCSKMIVAYDHSELGKKALEKAMNIAKQDKEIELIVIMVINIPYTVSYYRMMRNAELQAAKEILNEIEKKLNSLPNKSKTCVLEGNPIEKILDFVKQEDGDLIVMGSRGLSGLKEIFLGSVSHNVLHKATCPVLIVR